MWLLIIFIDDARTRTGTNHLHRLFDSKPEASEAQAETEERLGRHSTNLVEIDNRCPACKTRL